ncbi:hypothetical protein AWC20_20205 [Mycobacterium parmense]|nr:hypothetical protein AWC20_20205 [Mycobacterium parmense]
MGLTAVSTSSATISRKEACTVVSVMPYMLIRRGAAGWLSSQGRRRWGSSASPPNTTASSASSARGPGCAASALCSA